MKPLVISPPFSLDKRDSAIIKPTIGTLFELTNLMIDQYSLNVRLGQSMATYSRTLSGTSTASSATTQLYDTSLKQFLSNMIGCAIIQTYPSNSYGTISAVTSDSRLTAQLYTSAGVANAWTVSALYSIYTPIYSMVNGTVTTTNASILIDATNDQFDGTMIGCVLRNLTDGTYGIATSYTSTDAKEKITAQLYDTTGAAVTTSWTSGEIYSLSYPVMALHRFYGLNAATGAQIKEFYAASGTGLYYWDTTPTPDAWTAFTLPPNVTLQNSTIYPGRFRQLRDRTIYSNGYDPVLMIKKADTQVYKAGIPDPDQYVMLQNCESEITFDDALPVGTWRLYGNGSASKRRLWRDEHMTHHTEGDYGYCLEVEPETGLGDPITGVVAGADNAPEVHAVYRFPATKSLKWFFYTDWGTCTSTGSNTILHDTSITREFTDALIGQHAINTTDDSRAVVVDAESNIKLITSPLIGGSDNIWTNGDSFGIGEYSTKHDYVAIDIFRFTKIDIDELTIEFSSQAPTLETGGAATFSKGFRCVVYADSDFTHWDLKMRTMVAEWAMNPYGNKMFNCRFRKEWFINIPTLTQYVADAGSSGTTLLDAAYTFTTSMIGWKIDAYNAAGSAIVASGNITARLTANSVTCTLYAAGGLATAVGSKILTDSNASFSADIADGTYTVYNITASTSALITGRTSSTIITTTAAITFAIGDVYRIQKAWATGTKYAVCEVDDWDTINYMKIKLQQNINSYTQSTAKITFDNIRLLKTPPMPAELKIQVATCDPLETWAGLVTDDYIHATEGMGCKAITGAGILKWASAKDLLNYGDDDETQFEPGDVFAFDLGLADVTSTVGGLYITIILVDTSGYCAIGVSQWWTDITNPTERHIHKQEFELIGAFDWENVDYMIVVPFIGLTCYIDNIRITKPQASKVINNFIIPELLIAGGIAELTEMWIEQEFGENPLFDQISEFLTQWLCNFKIVASGQGQFIYPEFKHGRIKLGDYSIPCLKIMASAGGAYQVTIKRGDDLTEYEVATGTGGGGTGGTGKIVDGMMNLDTYYVSRPYSYIGQKRYADSSTTKNLGMSDWTEIPASDSDEFEIWMSSANWTNVRKIIFRFYQNQNMTWSPYATGTHSGGAADVKLYCAGKFDVWKHLWRRIRNTTTDQEGIITWIDGTDYLQAVHTVGDNWGDTMTWANGDAFTIEGWLFNTDILPEPDPDNYYEYELDVTALTLLGENLKSMEKEAKKYANVYAEFWESAREVAREMGVWNIAKDEDTGWYSLVIRWKRSDMVSHITDSDRGSGMQNIAGHGITVLAGAKDAEVTFQDWVMRKKGAISGEVIYKIKLEDETGYLGPASSNSKKIGVKGADVYLSDIYVPHDTRIKRKRIYRTDSTGEFRYLDTIDRTQTSYLDCVPAEELGNVIEPDTFEPPRAKYIEKVDNRIAYLNVIDRTNRYRRSRCYLSQPFVPHMCSDEDVFDLLPEDGQELRGIAYYMGHYLVWKDKSFYSVDPNTFERTPRSTNLGLMAPETLKAVPEVGYAWLSHEGICFGDHTDINTDSSLEVWDEIKAMQDIYGMDVLRKARAEYYRKHYILWVGINNENGYACYMPWRKWFKLEGMSVYSTSIFMGEGDDYELYAGDRLGYVNRLFYGNTDNLANISSAIRTLDYDFAKPHDYNVYLNYIAVNAKNLVSGAGGQSTLIFTPYVDQTAGTALTTLTLESGTVYKQYLLKGRIDPKDFGNLLGFRMTGSNRYAIKDFVLIAGDHGFRADLRAQ